MPKNFQKDIPLILDRMFIQTMYRVKIKPVSGPIFLEDLKTTKGVVSNARCLTEGVDVPIIDLIYICYPKNSKIDIVQASGRTL